MTGKIWLGPLRRVLDDEGAAGRVHVGGRAATGNGGVWRDALPADCSQEEWWGTERCLTSRLKPRGMMGY